MFRQSGVEAGAGKQLNHTGKLPKVPSTHSDWVMGQLFPAMFFHHSNNSGEIQIQNK